MFDNGNEIGYRDVDLLDTYFSGTTKTLTNKTLTSPTVSGLYLSDSGFSVEGSSADANETTVSFTNPTADRTITFPNATGNVAVFATAPTAAISDGSNGQVLTTNGSGVLSFSDMASGADLYAANPSSATDPSATGANAVAVGNNSTASGSNSFAFGTLSEASGTGAFAAGYDAEASGGQSTALGDAVRATGQFSFCQGGGNALASGSSSIAMGYQAQSTNTNSVAIARNTDATGSGSLAIGYNAQAISGTEATALTNSYASGANSFAAAISNNTSSYGATGANSVAMGKLTKATAASSVAIGESNTANSTSAIAMGYNSTASAAYATCIGRSGTASGQNASSLGGRSGLATGQGSTTIGGENNKAYADYAVAMGYWTYANKIGQSSYASGRFSADGDAQSSKFVLRSDTTDATPEALTTNNSSASTNNQVILENESAMTFTGTVVVREDASDGDDYAGWEIKGVIMRQGQASDTTLGVGIVNSLYHTSGLANAAVALSADTTNGGLKIQVTGIASTNLNWVATVHTSEVVNA